jgi:hypothetical protein
MTYKVAIHRIYNATHCNSIATQSKQLIFNYYSTIIQLRYNYTHDVMLASLIVIHVLKSNMWHYEDFWKLKKFQNIDLHRPL